MIILQTSLDQIESVETDMWCVQSYQEMSVSASSLLHTLHTPMDFLGSQLILENSVYSI